ncbi:hypothetical protein CAEBREN_09845 [Caenorhabditis brenneri]|uniref:ZZ-type domain-containing protein n=1 Tax=Caenorhabditis brenneri TaxID=135651 RepID=G0P4E6_CAEBE|nr:hypothetical protein CAEBREN_09845 [Caenorhabditis brenneri]
MACFEHNRTKRTDVTFRWYMYHNALHRTVVMDLECRCKVLDQLKAKFLEVSEIDASAACEIVFSSMSLGGQMTIGNGYEVYNSISPEINFYRPLPQLDFNVSIIEVPPMEKVLTLERALKECRTKIKSDKKWRILKDTEIAEEQLSIREMFEKQQKEIQALQTEVAGLKLQSTMQKEQECIDQERIMFHSDVHEASCDQCDSLIVGHRFKCTVCLNYDLCSKCEAQGAHPNHAMIRIVSAVHTEVPLHVIPEYRQKMGDKVTKKTGSKNCNCNKSNNRANAKKVYTPNPNAPYGMELTAINGVPLYNEQGLLNEHVPEIRIVPPFGQTAPFNHLDYSMKLVNPPPSTFQPVFPMNDEQLAEAIEHNKRMDYQQKARDEPPPEYNRMRSFKLYQHLKREYEYAMKNKLTFPSFLKDTLNELQEEFKDEQPDETESKTKKELQKEKGINVEEKKQESSDSANSSKILSNFLPSKTRNRPQQIKDLIL